MTRCATHCRVIAFFSLFDDDAACNPPPCRCFLFPLRRRCGVQSTRRVVAFISLFDDDAACNPHAMSSLSSPSSTTIQCATHRHVIAFFSRFDNDTACNPHAVSLLSSPALTTMRRAIHMPCRCFLLPLQQRCGVQSTCRVIAFFSLFDNDAACNPHAVSLLSSSSSTTMWRATHRRVVTFFSLFNDDVACNPPPCPRFLLPLR